ncbi:hypothetical protein ACIOJE_34900 [Kitasatospora sp. NPDC087861]|uniref:hypothetical protein n=1 Tax=Kitasatospora sp. NPDC087861 TaxID=3364070 RepID=UPI003815F760
MNTRVDPLLSELMDKVSSERGLSKRQVVEWALKQTYSGEYRQLGGDPNVL